MSITDRKQNFQWANTPLTYITGMYPPGKALVVQLIRRQVLPTALFIYVCVYVYKMINNYCWKYKGNNEPCNATEPDIIFLPPSPSSLSLSLQPIYRMLVINIMVVELIMMLDSCSTLEISLTRPKAFPGQQLQLLVQCRVQVSASRDPVTPPA